MVNKIALVFIIHELDLKSVFFLSLSQFYFALRFGNIAVVVFG